MRLPAFVIVLLVSGCDGADGGNDGGRPDPEECGPLAAECLAVCPDVNLEWCVFHPYPPPEECREVCAAGSCCDCVETDTGGREWASAGFVDCARPSCPNYIASDENCGSCLKDWGSGASYCADACASDDDCVDATNPWAQEGLSLVCHPDGYCTRPCETDTDCFLAVGQEYTCDASGACSFCVNCS
jgi:hypothetical protein